MNELQESQLRTLEWIVEHWKIPVLTSFVWGTLAINEKLGIAYTIGPHGSIDYVAQDLLPDLLDAAKFPAAHYTNLVN